MKSNYFMLLPNSLEKIEESAFAAEFAVLILSCDKFHDVWEPLLFSFEKYWGDCPFQIYLLSNYKGIKNSKIKIINVGEDASWSQNLINALEKIPQKNIMIWLDDVFIIEKVLTSRILSDARWFIHNQLDYLRLRNTDFRLIQSSKQYIPINEEAPYRTSIFATIWRKEVLSDLLVKEENPWQFELRGSIRSKKYKHFYSVTHSRFRYLHAIEKGTWIRTAVNWIQDNNLSINLEYRKQYGELDHILMTSAKVKGYLINLLPQKSRGVILKMARFFYRRVGLRDEKYYQNN